LFGYERPKADYEPDSIIEDIVKKFRLWSKLSPFLSCCSCLSVFLTLMRDYLRQVCTESSAIPENLAAFEGTLSDLRQRFNTPSLLFTARSTSCRCRFSTTTPLDLDASLQRRRELLAKPAEAAGWALHECFRLLDGPGGNAEGQAPVFLPARPS